MSDNEAGALIIRSLEMLEEVKKLHDSEKGPGPSTCKAICDLVEAWSNEQDFEGEYKLWDEKTIWFAPPEWKYADERGRDAWKACYELIFIKAGEEVDLDEVRVNFIISPIVGVGSVKTGIRIGINHKAVNASSLSVWKKYVQKHGSYVELMKMGFEPIEDGDWFITWRIDSEELASAYKSGNIPDALNPISDSLEKIRQAHPIFEKLLIEAETNFSQS